MGLERFESALDEELQKVASGGSVFKAVRGEYGCGKTFFARWLVERAKKLGFATSEVKSPRQRRHFIDLKRCIAD